MTSFRAIALVALVMLLAACQTGGPLRNVTQGDQLARYDFSESGSFEEGTFGEGAVSMVIEDGIYRIDVRQGDNELWWGQWGDSLADVILEVEVNQISDRNENSYGLMCRVRGTVGQEQSADPELAAMLDGDSAPPETEDATAEAQATPAPEVTDEGTQAAPTEEASSQSMSEGDGYLFLIQGTGQYGIFRSNSRSLTPLVDWASSAAIRQGPGENRLRAICVGDYLALYVNDQFVADAMDDRYREGQVGMVASSANRLGVNVEFDDLTVFAGS